MPKNLLCCVFLGALCAAAGAVAKTPTPADACEVYANASRHQCLKRELAVSEAALKASAAAVRRMMAQWDPGPNRRLATRDFEKTVAQFERYKRAQCRYFASMRVGVADQDEIAIARLECELRLNAERTRVFTDLTATVVM